MRHVSERQIDRQQPDYGKNTGMKNISSRSCIMERDKPYNRKAIAPHDSVMKYNKSNLTSFYNFLVILKCLHDTKQSIGETYDSPSGYCHDDIPL